MGVFSKECWGTIKKKRVWERTTLTERTLNLHAEENTKLAVREKEDSTREKKPDTSERNTHFSKEERGVRHDCFSSSFLFFLSVRRRRNEGVVI